MRFIYTKGFAIFSACLVAVALLAILQIQGWLDPIRLIILETPRPLYLVSQKATFGVKSFFQTVYRLKKIGDDNIRLEQKVRELQQELVMAEQAQRENEALRKELGFFESSKFNLIPCPVLSQNPFGDDHALVLGCGSDTGVEVGQAIVSQGYLAGKLVYVDRKTSTVVLANNSKFSVDAKINATGASAIVSGSFNSGMVVDQVPQNTDLRPGFLIVTAGIDPDVPKNILIGEAGDVLSKDSSLFKKATIMSPVIFSDLEFVYAVKP